MRLLIVYYSYTGNNRLLASELAKRLNCEICPIVEQRRRTAFTIILDMLLRRFPLIEPLEKQVSGFDHVILVAPIWAAKLATPMQSLIRKEKESIPAYSFITLCGYERPDQRKRIEDQLHQLAGAPPMAVQELMTCELLPEYQRNDVRRVSRHHVTESELRSFDNAIAAFLEKVNRTHETAGTQ